MAISVMPQSPTVGGVYQVRDTVPQLNAMSENAAKALRGMLDLGMDIHDYGVQKKQQKAMKQSSEDMNNLQEQIKADQAQLEQLKAQLAQLGG